MTATTTLARPIRPRDAAAVWDTEVLVLRGDDRAALQQRVRDLDAFLERTPAVSLTDLAYSVNLDLAPGGERLALVAGSVADLRKRLHRAGERLADDDCVTVRDTSGIYYFSHPLGRDGKVAFLFPGEGAQYPGMLRDVVAAFPEAGQFLDEIDDILAAVRPGERRVSELFLTKGDPEAEEELRRLDNAMISVLLADGALHKVMERLGVEPAFAAGHSMGEMAALSAAGCVRNDDGYLERFGATMRLLQRQEEESDFDCVLLAAGAGKTTLEEILTRLHLRDVFLAMDNCPHQTVIIGNTAVMGRVQAELQARGVVSERLSFRRPYHTPLFEPMLGPLRDLFGGVHYLPARYPVFSCTTAEPFPATSDAIRELAVRHWAAPVRFTEMIENMHAAGVRLFVEVGPRGNLSAFVEDILRGKRFAALPANVARRSGLTQLNHLVAQLAAHDVPLRLADYFAPRSPRRVEYVAAPRVEVKQEPVPEPAGDVAEVMRQYFDVMEQFLDLQREVTEAFLTNGTVPAEEGKLAAYPTTDRPLLPNVHQLVPGESVVLRRVLDKDEDLFVEDHTVGGRQVSKIVPEQHGVPVMPMTFSLEMMAEAASALAPGLVTVAIREIRLLRWLAFDTEEPPLIEVRATVERADGHDLYVRAEVRDMGPAADPHPTGWRAAAGIVHLSPTYPPAPPAGDLPMVNERPVSMTVEQIYYNLFHGPLFQGVTNMIRGGDHSIEATVAVLPRDRLFRSTPTPRFQLDPVLLDVVLHPMATWHLQQPDLAGKIMLPVGIDSAEFFGPPAEVGRTFTARSWITETSLRSFSHKGETLFADGTVYIRLDGIRAWRFYVPHGAVNFHGPKDLYFLGQRWTTLEAQAKTATPFALVRLEIPPDLKHPSMNRVTAQITLTDAEMREFRRRTKANDHVHDWLFDRIAVKDAIRLVWHDRTGERLYPADMEASSQDTRYQAHRRNGDQPFDSGVVVRVGHVVVALASPKPCKLAAVAIDDTPLEELQARAVEQLAAAGERVYVADDGNILVAWSLGEADA